MRLRDIKDKYNAIVIFNEDCKKIIFKEDSTENLFIKLNNCINELNRNFVEKVSMKCINYVPFDTEEVAEDGTVSHSFDTGKLIVTLK